MLTVPHSMCVTARSLRASHALKPVFRAFPKIGDDDVLAVFLMYERQLAAKNGNQSFAFLLPLLFLFSLSFSFPLPLSLFLFSFSFLNSTFRCISMDSPHQTSTRDIFQRTVLFTARTGSFKRYKKKQQKKKKTKEQKNKKEQKEQKEQKNKRTKEQKNKRTKEQKNKRKIFICLSRIQFSNNRRSTYSASSRRLQSSLAFPCEQVRPSLLSSCSLFTSPSLFSPVSSAFCIVQRAHTPITCSVDLFLSLYSHPIYSLTSLGSLLQ